MEVMLTDERLKKHLGSIFDDCGDDRYRPIAVLSAVISVGDTDRTETAIRYFKSGKFDRTAVYETVLQSYLFLGFPRMIEAALAYNKVYGDGKDRGVFGPISPKESRRWFDDGSKLCRKVYGKNYERLEEKFLSVSPELFRWMVVEGYGKVLSRPGLSHIERELAEVAALIVDGRRRQLLSHLLGSLNMGASFGMLKTLLMDIGPLVSSEHKAMTVELIEELERKNASVL